MLTARFTKWFLIACLAPCIIIAIALIAQDDYAFGTVKKEIMDPQFTNPLNDAPRSCTLKLPGYGKDGTHFRYLTFSGRSLEWLDMYINQVCKDDLALLKIIFEGHMTKDEVVYLYGDLRKLARLYPDESKII